MRNILLAGVSALALITAGCQMGPDEVSNNTVVVEGNQDAAAANNTAANDAETSTEVN